MPAIAVDARMIGASGIGVVLDSLLRRMITLRPDWRFEVYGHGTALSHLAAANVRLHPFDAPVYSLQEQRLGALLGRPRPDLVWAPHYNIPLLWRGRLLVTVHDMLHLAHPGLFPGLVKQAYARLMFRRVRRQASQIVFISEFTAREFSRFVGPPLGRQRVIHNGVNAAAFRCAEPSLHGRPYILYVGNIKPHKNLRRMVNAFLTIADRVPHDLVLVGQRDGFITGEGDIESLATGNARILFTGKTSAQHLVRWYANADALVMPSYYEGFGLPPLEAMAARCPVLAAQAASLPEICGTAALYCDPFKVSDIAEKLLTLLTDSALRERLRTEGAARVERFGWDRAVHAYLAAMENLL